MQTALSTNSHLGWVEIRHPFHPLRGQRFAVLKKRRVSGHETLIVSDPVRGTVSVRREWTDWAEPSESLSAGTTAHYFAYEPLPPAERLRYPQAIVERVRELAHDLHDKQIATQLNREGRRSAKGQRYNVSIVKWIRWRHHLVASFMNNAG